MLKLKMKEVKMKTIEEINQLRGDLLRSKKLFKDDSFFLKAPMKNIEWLRPHKICKNPQLIVDGISRFDVNQGLLGDCWFMAAVASLAEHKKLFYQIVCETNSDFNDSTYCGLFHFRFWHYGSWINIIIDDRLPISNGKLAFARSTSQNEFWPALLEKAYAKLHGGYEILEDGWIAEAFSNLTGGVMESYNLKNPPENFYEMIKKAFKQNTLIGANIDEKSNTRLSISTDFLKIGLASKHCYTVSNITQVIDYYGNVTELIRIRNPWGNYKEYVGDWSDSSKKWNKISSGEKQRINFNIKDDGEFWMSFKDFLYYFDFLEICNFTPDTITREPHENREWKVATFWEVWRRNGINKHVFEAKDPDPNDNEDYCTIVVAIMYISNNRKDKNRLELNIYPSNGKKILKTTITCYQFNETVYRYDVMPGQYEFEILSHDKHDDFEYLLRIFYETKKTSKSYPALKFSSVLEKSSKKDKVVRVKYYAQKKKSSKGCNIM